jgi:hypothetical protein
MEDGMNIRAGVNMVKERHTLQLFEAENKSPSP